MTQAAHVIVLGNEKGGSGKSTLATHLLVALMKAGHRVASIDTDSRQLSLTRYLENRARWARQTGLDLELPAHFSVRLGDGNVVREVEQREFAEFAEIIDRLGSTVDFVVIDTPANDSYRMRLSHALADTLVTPVNDSFVDLDVLGRIDPADFSVAAVSQYAELVEEVRRKRAATDPRGTDWIVVRNRLSHLTNRNQRNVVTGLKHLSERLRFRVADGISERVIFREFFPMGLTAFDPLDKTVLGVKPTMSHVAARREIRELLDCLHLPLGAPATAAEPANPASYPRQQLAEPAPVTLA
ncbi:division plane positioning ATPase MipZ [soil metagenome]